MDPLITVGTGLTVLGSKDLLLKILGPTADYIGGGLKGAVEKCNVNLNRVFERAKHKLGSRLDEEGAVNPRVLKHVFDDGRFADDDVVVEYYGGLLAGSKSGDGKGDQALPYLAMVQRMSVYQLRLHFLLYYEILHLHQGSRVNLGLGNEVPNLSLVIPHNMFFDALELKSRAEYEHIMPHSVVGLSHEGLVSNYRYGNLEGQHKELPGAPDNGILLAPSFLGAELFMWALGIEAPSGHQFFGINIHKVEKVIPIHGSAFAKLAKVG